MGHAFWNGMYYDPKSPDHKQMSPLQSLRYGATREGVHVIAEDEAHAMEMKSSFQYISKRKGVRRIGDEADGLFNAYGKADLTYETEQAATANRSIFWKNVLSLTKEDAERLGYTNVDAFRQLLNRHMVEVAREYNMSPQNLVWNAAYHPVDKQGRDHHPHIHVYMYSKDPNEGRMSPERTKKAFEKCRSIFTNDIFRDDLASLKEQHTQARDGLKKALSEYRFDSDAAIKSGLYEDFRSLSRDLPVAGRKVAYQYLKPELKQQVDAIVEKIVQQPGIDRAFATYENTYREQVKIYNTKDTAIESRMVKWRHDFFHPMGNSRKDFHNAVIRVARDINGIEKDIAVREAGGRVLDTMAQLELRQFVGVSAVDALRTAQSDAGYRDWLASLVHEYGAEELPRLMKTAQKENWREIYRSIHRLLADNAQLRQDLVDQCRVYLNPDEQERGSYFDGEDRLLMPGVREETADAVRAETQRILYEIRYVSETSQEYIAHLVYENALDQRVRHWFRTQADVCEELRRVTGAVRYRVDDRERPCPKGVSDAAYKATQDLLIRVANENPDLKQERDLLMIRSIRQSDSFAGMDRVLNGALDQAYRQELDSVFKDVLSLRSDHRDIYEKVKAETDVDGRLPKELQMEVASMIRSVARVPIDNKGVYNLSGRLSRMLYDERIGEELQHTLPEEMTRLKEIVALRSDAAALLEDPMVCKALDVLHKSAADIKIPEERLDHVLVRQVYSETLSEQMQQLYSGLPDCRVALSVLAKEIPCGTSVADLTLDQRQRLQEICPRMTMDDKTRDLFREKLLGIVEEQRLQQILHLPSETYEKAKKIVQMQQDITALRKRTDVIESLSVTKAIARRIPEVAKASEHALERVLIGEVCRLNRQEFVKRLYMPEFREMFQREAAKSYIGQPLSQMSADVRQLLDNTVCDKKGLERMAQEIEKRVYNERICRLLRMPENSQLIRLYLSDPHHRSLIERDVSFDQLSFADRVELTKVSKMIRSPEIDSSSVAYQEQIDRAVYHAAQNEMHEMRRIEAGSRGIISGLITASVIARQAMQQHAQNRQAQSREAKKKDKKKKKMRNKKQDHTQRQDPVQF